MSIIDDTFDFAFSSHVVEHQPDLIEHLKQVHRILRPGGRYFIIVPDKRYCFDHFIPESTVATVLQAREERRKVHTLQSIVEFWSMVTHNDPRRHWDGDHGAPDNGVARVRGAMESYKRAAGAYIDVHAWRFTPESFAGITSMLRELDLVQLSVERLYPTANGSMSFFVVLRRD